MQIGELGKERVKKVLDLCSFFTVAYCYLVVYLHLEGYKNFLLQIGNYFLKKEIQNYHIFGQNCVTF